MERTLGIRMQGALPQGTGKVCMPLGVWHSISGFTNALSARRHLAKVR